MREALPADVAALAEDAEALDPFSLDARLRAAVAALQAIDWQTGRLLRVLLDRRLHTLMGFPSASRYLRERLGCSERKARALLAVERRGWWAPGLAEAYRAGRLSWTQALTLLPVAHEETIAAWLARAAEVTVRRLADEVEWTLVRGRADVPPPPLGARLDVDDEALQTCARPRITVCAWHHLRGIHAGVVRAWGEAPDEITWEIGARSGRRALLRVEGVRLT